MAMTVEEAEAQVQTAIDAVSETYDTLFAMSNVANDIDRAVSAAQDLAEAAQALTEWLLELEDAYAASGTTTY